MEPTCKVQLLIGNPGTPVKRERERETHKKEGEQVANLLTSGSRFQRWGAKNGGVLASHQSSLFSLSLSVTLALLGVGRFDTRSQAKWILYRCFVGLNPKTGFE